MSDERKLTHPNAFVGGLSGVGGGELVLTLSHQLGWDISAGWAVAIAGGLSYLLLYIGKNGFAGAWAVVKHGTGGRSDGGDN